MRVWLTPPDGRARVYEIVAGWESSAPLRAVRSIGDLGGWLVDREIDPDDLTPA